MPVSGPDPHVLREYAVIADGERGALCGPRGDLTWLCVPRWHDDAVFSQLIGGAGFYAVTPVDRFVCDGSPPNALPRLTSRSMPGRVSATNR
jgi:hypothetical protein